jgi:hypothetical protein
MIAPVEALASEIEKIIQQESAFRALKFESRRRNPTT